MLPAHIIDELGGSLPAGLSATLEGDALRLDLAQRQKPGINGWLLTATITGLSGGTVALAMWCAALREAEGGFALSSLLVGGLAFVLGIITFVAMLSPLIVRGMKDSLLIETDRLMWGDEEGKVAIQRDGVLAVRLVSRKETASRDTDDTPSVGELEFETEQGFLGLFRIAWSLPELTCIGRAIHLAWDVPFTQVRRQQVKADEKPRVSLGWDRRMWGACVAGLALCLGFFAYWLAANVPRGFASESWPTVNGQATKVRYETSGDSIIAEITYTYNVDGVAYENDRIDFASMRESVEVTNLFKSRNVGSTVRVYYDPDDPATSVLVPGVHAIYFIGVVGIVSFGYLLVVVLRSRPPEEATAMQALYVPIKIEKAKPKPARLTRRGQWLWLMIITLVCGWMTWRLSARVQQYMTDDGWTRELIIVQTGAAILACIPFIMLILVLRKSPTSGEADSDAAAKKVDEEDSG